MEIQIGESKYRTGKLNGWQQFHVSRKIAPLMFAYLEGAGGAVKSAVKNGTDPKDISLFSVVGPIADMLSKMSQEDSEYVMANCLSVCHRAVGDSWQIVYALDGGFVMNDIGFDVMVKLAVEVIKENLGNFTDALSELF